MKKWYCSVKDCETLVDKRLDGSEVCVACGENNFLGPNSSFHYRHYKPIMVSAANKYIVGGSGVEMVIMGVRHHDPIMNTVLDAIDSGKLSRCGRDGQGFVDQKGRFWGRVDAFYYATANQSVNMEQNGSDKELCSEGLY